MNYNIILIFLFYIINVNFKFLNFFILFFILNCELINNYTNNIESYNLNINLLNGLFLIHPILIYYFYSRFLNILNFTLLYNNILISKKKYNIFNLININYIKNLIKVNIHIILVAISLGCWWAFQELNWGTWWNWDLVELINLFILLSFIFLIHNNYIYIKLNSINQLYSLLIKYLICILLVRYNLIQSIHNFLSIDNLNQYIQYVYYCLCFFLYFYFFLKIINTKKFYKFKYYNFIKLTSNIVFYIIIINLFYNFKVNTLQIFIYSYINTFILLVLCSIFYIILYQTSIIKLYMNFKLIFSWISNVFIISLKTFFFYRSIKKYKFIHLFIVIFILFISLNLLSFNISFLNNHQIQELNFFDLIIKNMYIYNNNFINNHLFFNSFLSSNLICSDTLNNFIETKEYYNQPSLSIKFNTFWSENFNSNKYIYLYTNLPNLLILLVLTMISFLLFFKKIRKIY